MYKVVVKVIPTEELTKELTNQIAIDQVDQYPVTSFEGYKNVTLMAHIDVRYQIHYSCPISSTKAPQLVKVFQKCYDELKSNIS